MSTLTGYGNERGRGIDWFLVPWMKQGAILTGHFDTSGKSQVFLAMLSHALPCLTVLNGA
jgi:hypothetical protein